MAHLGMICRHYQADATFPLTEKFPKKPHQPSIINPVHARFIRDYRNRMKRVAGVVKHVNVGRNEAFWAIEFDNTMRVRQDVHFLNTANKGPFHNPHQDVFVIRCGSQFMVYRRATTTETFGERKQRGASRMRNGMMRYPIRRLGPLGLREWPTVREEWFTDTVKALMDVPFADLHHGSMPILADALQDAGCDSPILGWLRDDEPEIRLWGLDATKAALALATTRESLLRLMIERVGEIPL